MTFTTCEDICSKPRRQRSTPMVGIPRILYGMAKDGTLPEIFGRVHPGTRAHIIGHLHQA
jgi:amino acid transporter